MADHPTIEALKATAPESSLPWRGLYDVFDANGFTVAWRVLEPDAAHIAAAVNAAPHLLARVAELEGALEAARVAVDEAEAKLKAIVASWPAHYHRQGCPWGACNCGADAANAARAEARRLCGVSNV